MPLLIFVYVAMLFYGSLFPFTGWTVPETPLCSFLFFWPSKLGLADIVQNVLVYAPLGLFVTFWLLGKLRFISALMVATVAGTSLSFIIENIQQFIPDRVASTSDVLMNLLGTLLGGLLSSFLTPETFTGSKLSKFWERWFRTGRLPNLGLIALFLWTLSQTSPLVPSLDIAELRQGLSLLFHTLKTSGNIAIPALLTYVLYITGLGLLTLTLGSPGKSIFVPFLTLIVFVLSAKVLVEGRQLSAEALIGAVISVILLYFFKGAGCRLVAISILGIISISAGFILSELTSITGQGTHLFNWIPFSGQMSSLSGFQNILELYWPLFAIAYLAIYVTPIHKRDLAEILGGVAVALTLFILEWFQQYLEGRYGDITQVLIALAGWITPWRLVSSKKGFMKLP